MKSWSFLRIACAVGAVVAGGVAFVFPPTAPIAAKAAAFLAGVAWKTPGHAPVEK